MKEMNHEQALERIRKAFCLVPNNDDRGVIIYPEEFEAIAKQIESQDKLIEELESKAARMSGFIERQDLTKFYEEHY